MSLRKKSPATGYPKVSPITGESPNGGIDKQGHAHRVECVAFTPDSRTLASADPVRLWDVATGEDRAAVKVAGVNTMAFSPDGKLLATGSADETVKLWRVANGTIEIDEP